MPLDRANVTVASRIMLPTYIAFFGVVGLNFVVSSTPRLFESPMLRYANELMPIQAWGALFLGCSLTMAVALKVHGRLLYRWGLLVCAFSMALWTLVAIVGIAFEPVSYSAWAWPALVTAACLATNRSLEKHEQDRRTEH